MATFEGTGIKNLKVRGGVYYWRQKIDGIQFSESLQTRDREEALKRMAKKADAASAVRGTVRRAVSRFTAIIPRPNRICAMA